MENNRQETESLLAGMIPSAPRGILLDCVELAATSDPLQSTPLEAVLEKHLRGFRPVPVPEYISVAFLATVGNTAFPAESQLIPFPVKPARDAGARQYSFKKMYSAAAAVALLGGLCALFVPLHDKTGSVAANVNQPAKVELSVPRQISQSTSKGFVPANFGRGVADVREHGVVWDKAGRPCRVVRVVYMDRAAMVNGKGERVEVEQPRVEYLLVPEKMD